MARLEGTLYTYIHPDMPEKERQELQAIHPREFVETDVFQGFSSMDNSLAVQESLREKGREDLIRPLPKVIEE